MAAPEITVGVVSWNAAEDLARCLRALPAALGSRTGQVVVVDNGSTDATANVLAGVEGVEVISNERNLGLTPGRNQVLDRVQGRYVAMLDADTIPGPGSLALLADYLEGTPQAGLAGARLLNPDGTLQLSCRTFPPPLLMPLLRRTPLGGALEHRRVMNHHLMRSYDHLRPRPVDWVMGACQFYRASLLPRVGRYDERIFSHGGEDTDWCVRVWKAGAEVHYVPDAEIVHVYGHYTRRRPFSKQARRAYTDYLYLQWKHRDARSGFAPA